MLHLESTNTYNAKNTQDKLRIGIIGVGAAGLAALKVLKDTHYVSSKAWEVIAFEERDDVGGIWLPSTVPSDPFGKDQRELEPPATPLYDSLTTNLPHPVMAFRCYAFPPETPLFPPADTVEAYLRNFAKAFDLMPYVRLNTKVVDARWDSKSWRLSVVSSSSNPKFDARDGELTKPNDNSNSAAETAEVYEFDRLIVTNGHYRIPRFPDLPGIDKWLRIGRAWHSAWYRNANDPRLAGRVIAVVGGGPSGQDISKELLKVASTVILCDPGATPTTTIVSSPGGDDSKHSRLIHRGRVVGFTDKWAIQFEDGTVDEGIDYCILATGYEQSFPFFLNEVMQHAMPLPVPPLPAHLHNSSYHVFPLAKQLFPLQADYPAWSVAFLGLLWRAAPLPVFEAQMQATIKVFANPSSLDITAEAIDMVTRYERLRREAGEGSPNAIAVKIGRTWHSYPDGEAFDYRDAMYHFVGLDEAKWMAPSWTRDIYKRKVEIREKWVALERSGEAAEWLKGVGHSGDVQEWVDLMWRVLEREDTDVAGQARL